MSLRSDLENARPGDTVKFRGRQPAGKFIGIKGTSSAWITLEGEDETAVLVPEPGYTASVFRPENCAYFRFGKFKIDGEFECERAVQIFRSNFIHAHDIASAGVIEDHFHSAGSNHVLIERVFCDGTGGQRMGGGKGPHAIYYTRIDGGGSCDDMVARDIDCTLIAGAAFQANGDGARLTGVFFERCRATEFGRIGGAGVNLAQCDDPELVDIILIPHSRSDNPGVASYDGTYGTTMDRYDIQCDEEWSGPMDETPGIPEPPEPPVFGADPDPGPEPEPEPGAGLAWCPSCDATGVQLGPDGTSIPCATCLGAKTIPAPS